GPPRIRPRVRPHRRRRARRPDHHGDPRARRARRRRTRRRRRSGCRPGPRRHTMSIVVDETRFETLVDDALDSIPDQLFSAMDNVVVLVADRHPEEPDLLGLYEGGALTERDKIGTA